MRDFEKYPLWRQRKKYCQAMLRDSNDTVQWSHALIRLCKFSWKDISLSMSQASPKDELLQLGLIATASRRSKCVRGVRVPKLRIARWSEVGVHVGHSSRNPTCHNRAALSNGYRTL